MEDFECLTKCQETEFTGKLDPTKEPPSFVTDETEEVQSQNDLKLILELRGNDMEFINQIMPSLVDFVAVVIGVALMYAGQYVKKLYNQYADTQTKKDVVETTVQYVEQVYKDIHGQEKLDKALERASELLKEKGIAVSDTELETLIESAVCGFNDGFYKGE